MAYIIFVNPSILMQAGMNARGLMGEAAVKAGLSAINDPVVASVFAATCIAAAIGTFIMAFNANLPFAQAPGMGLNAFLLTVYALEWDTDGSRHWLQYLFQE